MTLHESGHFDLILRDDDEDEVYELIDWHAHSLTELDDLILALTLVRDTAEAQGVLDRTAA